MANPTKQSNCRSSSRRWRARNSDGIVLVILLMMVTLLLVTLTAVAPSIYQEGRREREAELIFRGTQYGRAVALFHKQFGRYPVSVKEMLQTNGMRFLRKEYSDPMDPKGKWRFIHVNAAGVLLDSINQQSGLNGNNPNPAGLGATSTNSISGNSMFGGSSLSGGFSSGGSSFSGSSSFGGSSFGSGSSFGGSQGGFGSSSMNPSGSTGQIGPTSSFFGGQNGVQGAYIAGVAATTHHDAIKVWGKHRHYDEWEFLGLDMGIFGIQVGTPGGGAGGVGMGQQPASSGSGFSTGTFGPTSSPSGFGGSSFGPSSN